MTDSDETAADDASDYSEELGGYYPRIDYPQEVYDRACGRLPVKPPPVAKKRNVEDWLNLSDSQSSQATTVGDNDVSSRDRKRKKKRAPQAEKTNKRAAPKRKTIAKKKVGRKSKRRKQEVNYVEETEEESSDETETETEDDTSSSEVDSTPEKKKKKIVISKTQRFRSADEKESRGRMESGKTRKLKSGSKAKDIEVMRAKSQPSLNEKKEKKTMDVKSEKKESSDGKDSSMKEKHRKAFSAKEIETIVDKVHPNEKKVKKEVDAESEKKESSDVRDSSMKEKRKVFSAKEIEAIVDKVHPMKKKVKKEVDADSEKTESSDGKESSMSSMKEKKQRDSSHEVPRNAKQKDNRSESTVPSTSQPPAGPLPRKSILKKSGSSMSHSSVSGNSVLPSIMQDLFNNYGLSAPSSSSSSLLTPFKVPKKSNTVADRSKKKVAVSPPLVERSEESEESSNGWDPRNVAFVPPARNFGRPPVKPVMGAGESRKSSEGQRPTEGKSSPVVSTPPIYRPSIVSSNERRRSQLEEDETWKKMMSAPQPGILPFASIISPNEMESARAILTAKRSDSIARPYGQTTPRGDPRGPRQEKWKGNGGGGGPSASPMYSHKSDHFFPTPKSTERREDYGKAKQPSHGWTTSGWTESPQRTMERRDRWNESTPPSAADSRELSPPMNTPLSPPRSASPSFGRSPMPTLPTRIPIDKERAVRYRLISIDDQYLPWWNRSDRFRPAPPAMYAVSSPRCRAIVAAGPFLPTTDKTFFERMMKLKGADVEWTEAPATKDAEAMKHRSIAALLCYSESTAKALLEEKTVRVHTDFVPLGSPLEVLVRVDGVGEGFDEKELAMEMTDVLETYIGALVELLLFSPSRDCRVVEGKARFFYSVHATRAACGPVIPLGGGRSISFALCPPEKTTKWIADVLSESSSEEDVAKKPACSVPATPVSTPVSTPIIIARSKRAPLLPTPPGPPLSIPSVPQPVPPPSLMSLSLGRVIKTEPGTTVSTTLPTTVPSLSLGRAIKTEPGTTTVPSISTCSLPSASAMSMESQQDFSHSQPAYTAGVSPYGHSSRFGALPTTIAIPPPGLVDPKQLGLLVGAPDPSLVYAQTMSTLSAIAVPPSLIPLPPPLIPPPTHIVPVLPHPDLPAISHDFFPPPSPRVDPRGRSSGGGEQRQQQRNVDPATFIKPFKALLPKREPREAGEEEEEELLLYARPVDGQPTDWDAVRAYFRDDDCSSRVYGGVVSLRYTGERAREKAQLLLVQAPHVVNNQQIAVGLTYSVLFSANKAIGKTRLYDEVMHKFGSVVEVEKKCDTPAGRPVYKIYFDSVERARRAAVEGITVGESTLTNIGPVPT